MRIAAADFRDRLAVHAAPLQTTGCTSRPRAENMRINQSALLLSNSSWGAGDGVAPAVSSRQRHRAQGRVAGGSRSQAQAAHPPKHPVPSTSIGQGDGDSGVGSDAWVRRPLHHQRSRESCPNSNAAVRSTCRPMSAAQDTPPLLGMAIGTFQNASSCPASFRWLAGLGQAREVINDAAAESDVAHS